MDNIKKVIDNAFDKHIKEMNAYFDAELETLKARENYLLNNPPSLRKIIIQDLKDCWRKFLEKIKF